MSRAWHFCNWAAESPDTLSQHATPQSFVYWLNPNNLLDSEYSYILSSLCYVMCFSYILISCDSKRKHSYIVQLKSNVGNQTRLTPINFAMNKTIGHAKPNAFAMKKVYTRWGSTLFTKNMKFFSALGTLPYHLQFCSQLPFTLCMTQTSLLPWLASFLI
jgi:hypothetical protein